jgi:hypothetical protein
VACVVASCGATEKTGRVGQTLADGGLRVAVIKVARHVAPVRGPDYPGLGTPSPGTRFVGVEVKACDDRDNAILPVHFGLELAGGGKARLRFPQSVYSNGFDSVRSGCGRGWVLFEAPRRAHPTVVTFAYDDTGSARPGSQNSEKHARFRWRLR